MLNWAEFTFPAINLYNYPKQNRDFKMSNINDVNLSSHYETNVHPQWVLKDLKADDTQVEGTHYKDMAIEPWDVMEVVLTHEEFVGYLKGNFIKYAMRDGKKFGAVKDAAKARHYEAKLKEVEAE
jgi:hypothetical protein